LSHVETDLAEEVVKEIKDEIRDVKTLLVSGSVETNETRREEVAKEIRNETDRLSDEIRSENSAPVSLFNRSIEPAKCLRARPVFYFISFDFFSF